MFLHVFMCVMTTQDDDGFFSGYINRLLDGVCVWQGKAYYPNGIMRMLRYAAMHIPLCYISKCLCVSHQGLNDGINGKELAFKKILLYTGVKKKPNQANISSLIRYKGAYRYVWIQLLFCRDTEFFALSKLELQYIYIQRYDSLLND